MFFLGPILPYRFRAVFNLWRGGGLTFNRCFFDGLLCPVYGAQAGAIRSPVGFGAWPGL